MSIKVKNGSSADRPGSPGSPGAGGKGTKSQDRRKKDVGGDEVSATGSTTIAPYSTKHVAARGLGSMLSSAAGGVMGLLRKKKQEAADEKPREEWEDFDIDEFMKEMNLQFFHR